MGIYIIAEAGVNHNGNVEIAKKLCDAAKKAGADAVKFQTWVTEKIITGNVEQAAYQKQQTGTGESQYDMLKKLELSYDDFFEIKKYCDEIGITFFSTADESDSLDFLLTMNPPFIKVGSGEKRNVPYLRYIGSKGLPVILSTGMCGMEDVRVSVDALKEGGANDITLLHCTTSYPCPYDQVNLNAMLSLRDEFGLPVGYSDHTMGVEVSVAAAAMGARVIEKHLTLDRNMAGPDHEASTEPDEFAKMVQMIRNIETAMGDGVKKITINETENEKVVIKRIVAARPIRTGDIISESMVTLKRNDIGEEAYRWDDVIGSIAGQDYEIDEGIVL